MGQRSNSTIISKSVAKLCKLVIFCVVIKGVHTRDQCFWTSLPAIECPCLTTNTPPWGVISRTIDCQNINITDQDFDHAERILITDFTEHVILSLNQLSQIPLFESTDLLLLDLSINHINQIDDNSFAHLPNLIDLNLSWNQIKGISMKAFRGLDNLRTLNLAGNQLRILGANIFSPLPMLEHLIMSHNRALNETLHIDSADVYLTLGVTPKLKILELNNCSLSRVDISQGVDLEQLQLRGNNFTTIKEFPLNIKNLDLSDNPFVVIGEKFLPHLTDLEILILEDMPVLSRIEDFAFIDLPSLREINLQNNWNMSYFSPLAFGNEEYLEKAPLNLSMLNLRGGFLMTLNSSLLSVFQNIKEIDLFGNPFICDCRIAWLQQLAEESNAVCAVPKSIREKLISSLDENRLECRRWPSWVVRTFNGLLVLLLLILCAAATWLIVMGLRPSKRNKILQKIGAHSPYARVTIQPNSAE